MSPRPRTGADRGFTLVEALVSIFVFSLIAAGAAGMLIQTTDAQRRTGLAHEELRSLQVAQALIAADFAQVVLRSPRRDGATRTPAFEASEARVAFVRAASDGERAAGVATRLVAVEYAATEAGLVRRTREAIDAPDAGFSAEQVLLPGAADIEIRFHDGAQWRAGWVVGESGVFPRGVSIAAETRRHGPIEIKALVGLGA
jgi:general secretion pathway protein J